MPTFGASFRPDRRYPPVSALTAARRAAARRAAGDTSEAGGPAAVGPAGDTADGLGDTAQGEYTILHVTVTNIGDQPQTLDDSSQYAYDASGRKYSVSTSADLDLNSVTGSDSVFFNNINPGNTVHGELAFDMPAGARAVKAELHDSAFSGGITVSLTT